MRAGRTVVAVLIAILAVDTWGESGSRSRPATDRSDDAQLEKRKDTEEFRKLRGLIDAADFTRAESEARSMLARFETGGRESLEVAWTLELLAGVLRRVGKVRDPELLRISERAAEIKEAILGPGHPELAVSLTGLGTSRRFSGNPSGALEAYRTALEIQQRAYGPEHVAVAATLNEIGIVLMDRGSLQEASETMQRALAIRKKLLPSEHPDLALSYSNMAVLLRNMGDFTRAGELNERALAVREKILPPGHPDIAYCLNLQGDIQHRLGDYAGARALYTRALEMRERATPPDPLRLSEVTANLGDLERDLGNYQRARILLERALSLRQQALGDEHFFVGFGHSVLGALLKEMGEHESARSHLERALRIIEKLAGPANPMVAAVREDLGDLLYDMEDLAGARDSFSRAIETLEAIGLSQHPSTASCLTGLANVLRDSGDSAAARPLYEKSLEIRRAALGPQHPQVAETLIELARLQAATGDMTAALDAASQGEGIIRRHLHVIALGSSERDALRYEAIRLSGLNLSLELLVEGEPARLPALAVANVWDQLVRSRALVLDVMATRHRTVLGDERAGTAARIRDLSRARDLYAKLVVQGPDPNSPANYRAALEKNRTEMEAAERALAETGARVEGEPEGRELGSVRVAAGLPAGSSLVSYVVYTGRERPGRPAGTKSYAALVLESGRTVPVVVPIGPAAEIDERIGMWKSEVSRAPAGPESMQRYREAGSRLRRALWDPVAPHVGSSRTVFVVPDGAIHMVSLATLPIGPDRYLVESGPLFHYLSAERDLARGPARRSSGSGLLVLGGPDFDLVPAEERAGKGGASRVERNLERGATLDCGEFRSVRFASLPASGAEAEEVERLWRTKGGAADTSGGVLKLTGARATEAAFKRHAPGHRILHLATHGFTLQDHCDDGSSRSRLPRASPENPLLLAGLALAGANRRYEKDRNQEGEDGILTAEEIASLDLRGVEWAVLSACETGVGPVQTGEGVLGLRRAFEVAGAGTLIMSLWPVTDNDALAWVTRLYTGRLEGMSTADAVRAASVRMIEARRRAGAPTHPFFWGAFVAAGDWR